MFADDTKIWTRSLGFHMNDFNKTLTLSAAGQTAGNRWLLRFNPDKCKVMHIKHEIHTSYSIKQGGKEWPLQAVSEEKYLGIVTTNDLKVSRQCAEAAAKANRVLGMVQRNLGNLDEEGFLIM